MDEKLITFGKISKTHGFSGAMVFVSYQLTTDVIREKDWVFVERHGEKVPYRIDEINIADDKTFIAKLSGIDSEEKAREFSGSEFYFPASSLKLSKSEEFYFEGLGGWKVFNGDDFMGEVAEAVDNNGQILLTVINAGNEFLIPLVEEFIIKTDEEDKVLILSLPDGLTDLA